MSLILTTQNTQPAQITTEAITKRPSSQELLEMAIHSAKRAALFVNGIDNMREMKMSDLQLVAFNLRLTLETLDLLKRRNNHDE